MRDRYDPDAAVLRHPYVIVDRLLDRYRECSDYGLTLRPEDDELGDP